MTDTLEVRIAHLEGAYEQIDKRLAAVEASLSQLRQEFRQEISQLRQESRQEMSELRRQMVEQFRWILGFQILAWLTTMGTLLALLFRR